MTNIPQAYKYRYNGVIYIGGALPDGAELLETINRIDEKTAQTIETMDIVDPKANIDLSNCTKPYITETYVNGTSWYRVYSDGWCEQGGRATISSYYANITFLKQFVDTNYNIGFAQNGFSEDTYCANVQDFTNSTMRLRFRGGGTFCFWQACGYI